MMAYHFLTVSMIVLISFGAYRLHVLSVSGALASFFVGFSIYLGLSVRGLIILGIFFATSSFWSSFKRMRKKAIEEKLEKGSRRDWVQVLANGGVAAVASLMIYFTKDQIWELAFLISIASATGDTWSSEIGPLSKRRPVSVRDLRMVDPGTSGAISLLGSFAAVMGVVVIVISAYLLLSISNSVAVLIFIFGILGNVVDTLLGAYLQRTNYCSICLISTEKTFHCQTQTVKIRGKSYLNNDGVNFIANLISPVLGILFIVVTKSL